MGSKFCHIGSLIRSLGQNEGIPYGLSRGHSFSLVDWKICQNIVLDDLSYQEIGSHRIITMPLGQNKKIQYIIGALDHSFCSVESWVKLILQGSGLW